MDLLFTNVTLLAYQHTPILLDAGIKYKLSKTFTVIGILLDQSATQGVGSTWSKAEILHAVSGDNLNIVLNGISFGVGKVLNVNFDSGIHVQQQKYVYTIQATSDGDFSNASTGVYQGIDWSRTRYLESIEETFSYSLTDAGDKVYDHRCSIRFTRDVTNLSLAPIDFAKTLAASLFAAANLTSFVGDYNLSAFRKIRTQSYNAIDFSASLIEKTTIPFGSNGTYSASFILSLQTNEKGVTDVTDKVIVHGLVAPTHSSAWVGMAAVGTEAAAYARSSSLYLAYGVSSLPLHDIAIQKNVTDNKFEGTVEQSCRFSNDPFIFNYAKWSRNLSFSRSVEGYITVSESGSVRGIGRVLVNRFSRAKTFYNSSVIPSLMARLSALYTSQGGIHLGNLKRIRQEYGRAEFLGEITYSEAWTDNNLYTVTAPIKKATIEISTEYPVHLTQLYSVSSHKQVIQPQNTSTAGSRTIDIKLKGARGTSLSQFVNSGKDIIVSAGYHLIGVDNFIQDCNFKLSPNSNDFSMSVKIAFHGFHKSFGDLILT